MQVQTEHDQAFAEFEYLCHQHGLDTPTYIRKHFGDDFKARFLEWRQRRAALASRANRHGSGSNMSGRRRAVVFLLPTR